MKNNKHPHHDLIVEWAKDTSKEIQSCIIGSWSATCIEDVISDANGDRKYRFKPREFQKGHWYPCVDGLGDSNVYFYDGKEFCLDLNMNYDCSGDSADTMRWIGESLGEIKFGGEE